MENKKGIHNITTYIIFGVCIILLPGLIGGLLAAINQNILYLEVCYVVFGLIDLLLITIRIRIRDGQNYKKNKSIDEDKTSDEYKVWLKEQYLIAIFGGIDLLTSLVVFLITTLII